MPREISAWFADSDSAEQIRKELAGWRGVRSAVVDLEPFPADPTTVGNFSFTGTGQIDNYTGLVGMYAQQYGSGLDSPPGIRLTVSADNDVADGVRDFMLEHGALNPNYFGD